MNWFWSSVTIGAVLIYFVGALFIFAMEASVGPVAPALAAVRALVWPYYIATGSPQGFRQRSIGEV